MKRSQYATVALLLLSLVIATQSATGQAEVILRIDEIRNDSFPDLTLKITALDNLGYPLPGLSKDNFSLSEDSNVVTDFQVTPINQHPVQVVIALDTSRSMEYGSEPTPLQSSTAAAQEFLAGLGLQDQAAIVAFSDQAVTRQDLTSDLLMTQSALSGLSTSSNTALNDAIYMSSGILQGRGLRPVIILVTDGKDSGVSQHSFDEALQAVTQLKGIVFPIGWGGASHSDLQRLADLTHGEAQFLTGPYPDQAQFLSAFTRIQTFITEYRTQYQLSYKSSLPADGQEHELALGIDYLGLHTETTRRFAATQGEIYLTFPTLSDGQTVSGRVTFAPQIDAPAAMEQLEILVDGQPLAPIVAEPFVYEWDSTQVLPGEHQFTFKARDQAGNLGETSLQLVVVTPIQVEITTPKSGADVEGLLVVSANVTAQAKISRVEFQIDGRLIGQVENPPFEMNWSAIGAAAGGHEIVVTAYDANGYSAESRLMVNKPGGGGPIPPGIIVAIILAAVVLIIPIGVRLRKRRKAVKEDIPSSPEEWAVPLPAPGGRGILREIEGLNPQHEWMLSQTDEISLGRKRDANDIPLKGETASRQHLVIRYQDGSYVLYNLRPDNPTLVNDIAITQQCVLNPGDLIQAGESLFQFEMQA